MRVAGTMSGTSLDGVDAAVIETDGVTVAALGATAYRPYSAAERAVLGAAMGRWDGLEEAARVVETAHAEVLSRLGPVDLVGFHGQTTAHDPRGRGTCQIGDGARLSARLGAPVAWDFRSADVAAGGQGAPLAPFYHHAAVRRAGLSAPAAVLNLGGVGNLTWLDPGRAVEEACLAFDTGPANAPLNDMMVARRGAAMDEGGALAAAGRVDEGVIARLQDQSFFGMSPPKSLDRNDFAWLGEAVAGFSDADAAATLTAAAARPVGWGLALCPAQPARLFVTGGGRRNPVLMAMVSEAAGLKAEGIEALGLDGDMVEAQAFGYLAARVVNGLPISAPGTTGVPRPMTGGRVSQP